MSIISIEVIGNNGTSYSRSILPRACRKYKKTQSRDAKNYFINHDKTRAEGFDKFGNDRLIFTVEFETI